MTAMQECEHHLALEESQLRLQMIHNENLQSRLMTSESKASEESLAESSGMRDMRIMGLRSELHMKQSLLDRMQHQLDWIEESVSLNFPVNKPEDPLLVDRHMEDYNMKCTCKLYVNVTA